jgi:FAD/FMN-containing dehydrogenase
MNGACAEDTMNQCESWGRFPPAGHPRVRLLGTGARTVEWDSDTALLPIGMRRSYGDACINAGGTLLEMRGSRNLLAFDGEKGILRCEAGVNLQELLDFVVPRGWFLPVTPGTKFVTVGGAIANDVHGKNHHEAGTFGRHVLRFLMARSDGSVREYVPGDRLFAATIGGLGLTGVILWAEIQLIPIKGPWITADSIPFGHYSEFFELSRESEREWPYVVAWVDCLARGKSMGRGVLFRGRHSSDPGPRDLKCRSGLVTVPFDAPSWCLSSWSLNIFNATYAWLKGRREEGVQQHFDPFFYPLDAVNNWNRLYGKQGFFQFQCVADREVIAEVISLVSRRSGGSFLAVLKEFGEIPSPGLLSFPCKGVTVALDLPYKGESTIKTMAELEKLVVAGNGRIYPAKDALMTPASFQTSYPKWRELEALRDPLISSTFWRRVVEAPI